IVEQRIGVPVEIVCLDHEGVLIPEIWINFAERTGMEELRATTRDIPDYDVLMKQRLKILDEHGFGLPDIQAVIDEMGPLEGAREFLDWAREHFQVVILSDTFYEFAHPLMRQLGWPTLFCHRLEVNDEGRITDYILLQVDPERASVKPFHSFKYRVIAAGHSYNVTTMMSEAEAGILIHAPQNVRDKFPQFPAVDSYEDLKREIINVSQRDIPM